MKGNEENRNIFKTGNGTLCSGVSCAAVYVFVKPDRGYVDYLDARVLALLFCLMTVMEGSKNRSF